MSELWTALVDLQAKGVWGIIPSVVIVFGTVAVVLFAVSAVLVAADKFLETIRRWRGKA